MNALFAVLRDVARELDAAAVRYAVVGGLAVSARVEPRFTRDVDLAIAVPSDAEAERVASHLMRRGYRVLAQIEQAEVRRLATLRLATPGGGEDAVVVDLLFACSGIESEAVADAEPVELVAGLTLPVARLAHLIAMKVLSRDDDTRPDDRRDLRELLTTAAESDIALARSLIGAIQSRGYARGRDLAAGLDELLRKR